VQWWSTLHQGATIRIVDRTTMAGSMLAPLVIMIAACWSYSIAIVLFRLRCLILEREPVVAMRAEAQ
jgi:heme exporter protein C